MTDHINDGGPAFPVVTNQYHYAYEKDMPACVSGGMTLRDYLAAKALAGLIAEPQWREGSYSLVYSIGPKTKDEAENYATAAYRLADAMLAARSKP